VNAWVCETSSESEVGKMDTEMGTGGAVLTVTVAEADLAVSATDVAMSVTVGGFGTFAGAEYVTW
jgi:hypothetical protein